MNKAAKVSSIQFTDVKSSSNQECKFICKRV